MIHDMKASATDKEEFKECLERAHVFLKLTQVMTTMTNLIIVIHTIIQSCDL